MLDSVETLHLETLQQIRNPKFVYYFDSQWKFLFSNTYNYVLPQVIMYILDYLHTTDAGKVSFSLPYFTLHTFITKASNKEVVTEACVLQHIAKLRSAGLVTCSDKMYSKTSCFTFHISPLLSKTYIEDIKHSSTLTDKQKLYFPQHLIQYIYHLMVSKYTFLPIFKTFASRLTFKEAVVLAAVIYKRPFDYLKKDFIQEDRFWLQLGYLSNITGLYTHTISKILDKLQTRGVLNTVNTLQRRFVYEDKKSVWQLRERKWIYIHYNTLTCLLSFNMRSVIDPSVYKHLDLQEHIKTSLDNYYELKREVKKVEEQYENPEAMQDLFAKMKQENWIHWQPIYMRKRLELAKKTLPRDIAYLASTYEALSQRFYADYRISVNAFRTTGKNYRAYEKLSKFIQDKGYSPYVYLYAQFYVPNKRREFERSKTRPFLNTLRGRDCEDRYHELLAAVLTKHRQHTSGAPDFCFVPRIALVEDKRLKADAAKGFQQIYRIYIANMFRRQQEEAAIVAHEVLQARNTSALKEISLIEIFASNIPKHTKEILETDTETWVATYKEAYAKAGYGFIEASREVLLGYTGLARAGLLQVLWNVERTLYDYFLRSGTVVREYARQTSEEAAKVCVKHPSWALGVFASSRAYQTTKQTYMQIKSLTDEQFEELKAKATDVISFTEHLQWTEFDSQADNLFNGTEYIRDGKFRYAHEIKDGKTYLTEPSQLPLSLVEFASYSRKFSAELLATFKSSVIAQILVYRNTPLEDVLLIAEKYSDFKHFKAYEERMYQSFSALLAVK